MVEVSIAATVCVVAGAVAMLISRTKRSNSRGRSANSRRTTYGDAQETVGEESTGVKLAGFHKFLQTDCDRETTRTFGDCAPSNRQDFRDTADFLEFGAADQEGQMRGNGDRLLKWALCGAVLACAGNCATVLGSQSGQDPRRPDSYDNSAPEKPPSPDETAASKMTPADHQLVQKIQNAIRADEKLSDSAHKMQATARDGKVTLSGVVASQAERTAVVSKVKDLAGAGNVVSHLKIKTGSE